MGKKIGYFFGSFNPIHNGHITIANYCLEEANLDEVVLMVSPQNPFKEKKDLLDEDKRFFMVNESLKEYYPKIQVSAFEFTLPKPTYTFETLKLLRENHEDDEIWLILGFDNFCDLGRWKNVESLIKSITGLIVLPRISKLYTLNTQIHGFKDKMNNHFRLYKPSLKGVFLNEMPILDVSSTWIRNNIETHPLTCKGLMPYQAWAIMEKEEFYKEK